MLRARLSARVQECSGQTSSSLKGQGDIRYLVELARMELDGAVNPRAKGFVMAWRRDERKGLC